MEGELLVVRLPQDGINLGAGATKFGYLNQRLAAVAKDEIH